MKDTNQALFDELLMSESESEVIKVLKKYKYWDISKGLTDWKYFGDNESNYSTVTGQTTDIYGALVEKLMNSVDANLILEARKRGIDPEGEKAPQSLHEATDLFYGIKEGKLRSISAKEQEEIAQKNMLVATGERDNPAFMIIDRGEGQSSNTIEDTLLSLNRGNKQKIKFVQGLHNQGGTAVIRHLGEYGFQLVASKRHPDLLEKGDSDLWCFTLTRRADSEERGGGYRGSTLLYLAPGGDIPTLNLKTIPVLPDKNNKPYKKTLEQGTVIKLYDYKVPQKSKITLHLRRKLNFILLSAPLPIKIIETREYGGGSPTDRILGQWNVKEDQFVDGIKYGKLNIPEIGGLEYKYGVFQTRDTKEKKSDSKNTLQAQAEFNSGAYFTVNGQTHGDIPNSFIKGKCKLDELENNLLIDIDINSVSTRVRENLTKTDRQNSSEGDERDLIEKYLIPAIKDNPFLKELNAKLRREKLKKAVESDANFEELFQNLLRNSIDFDNIMRNLEGQKFLFKTTMPEENGKEENPKLYKFPTFFSFDNNKDSFTKNVPINNSPEFQLITDAQDDYFDRMPEESPGRIEFIHDDSLIISHRYLSNGRFYIKLQFSDKAKEGDKLKLIINVTDDNQEELGKKGFSNNLNITVSKALEKKSGTKKNNNKRKKGNGKKSTPTADLPRVQYFYLKDRPEWNTKTSLVYNDTDKSWHGNLDNKYLNHYKTIAPKSDKKLIEHWFFYGLLMTGLGLVQDNQTEEEINKALRGNSAHIITAIELYKMKYELEK